MGSFSAWLFVAQRLNGVEPGRFARRVDAEEEAYHPGKHHRSQHGGEGEHRGDACQRADGVGTHTPQPQPDKAADHRQNGRFGEELEKDCPRFRPQGLSDADFPGAR